MQRAGGQLYGDSEGKTDLLVSYSKNVEMAEIEELAKTGQHHPCSFGFGELSPHS